MIERIASKFRTPDGAEHPTWNAARKHQTGLDLLDTMREAGPDLTAEQLARLRNAVVRIWHVSRKKSPT